MPKKKRGSNLLRLSDLKRKSTAEENFIRRMKYAERKPHAPPCDAHPKTRPITPDHVDLGEVCPQLDTPSAIHLTCNWDTPILYPANQNISSKASVDTESTSTPFNTHQDVACKAFVDTESTSTPFNTHQDVASKASFDTESTSTPFNTHQDVACKAFVDTESTSTPFNTQQDVASKASVDTASTSTPFNTHQDVASKASVDTESTSTPFNTHQDVACKASTDTESTSTPFNTHQDVACKASVDTASTSTPFNTHQDVASKASVDTASTSTPFNTHQDVASKVSVDTKLEPTSLTPNTLNGTSSKTRIQLLDRYISLRNYLSTGIEPPFLLDPHHKSIHLLQLYQSGNRSVVKTSVTIMEDFTATVNVHGKDISQEHELWSGLPAIYDSVYTVRRLLRCICKYSVCIGNPDVELQDLVPVGACLTDSDSLSIRAYGEGDFCASKGKVTYTSTIRSVKCCLLVEGARCASCASYRRALRKRKHRQEERMSRSAKINYLHRRTPHATMSHDMLQQKMKQQKDKIRSLESELDALRTCHSEIITNEVSHGEIQIAEMSD